MRVKGELEFSLNMLLAGDLLQNYWISTYTALNITQLMYKVIQAFRSQTIVSNFTFLAACFVSFLVPVEFVFQACAHLRLHTFTCRDLYKALTF